MENSISTREKLDLHEIMMFKVLCGTKSLTMKALVPDEELKSLMEQDVKMTTDQLKELKKLINTNES